MDQKGDMAYQNVPIKHNNHSLQDFVNPGMGIVIGEGDVIGRVNSTLNPRDLGQDSKPHVRGESATDVTSLLRHLTSESNG
jgi:hypothetical protein